MSLQDFSSSLLYDNDFTNLNEKKVTKSSHHRLGFVCKLIGVIALCVLLVFAVILGACYLAYRNVAPPGLICTYSVDAQYTTEIVATGAAHSYAMRLHSLNEGGAAAAKYSEVSTYPHNGSFAVITDGEYRSSVPFFDRRICTKTPGRSTCLSISTFATKAKWKTPCPSDSSTKCDVYTREWKSKNETWYIFPEGYGNITGKRVPSGYYFAIKGTVSKAVFTNYNFTPPDSSYFEFNHSGYCYDTGKYSEPRFAYKPGVRTLVPTDRAYDLINTKVYRVAERQPSSSSSSWVRGDNACFDGLTYADMRQRLIDEFAEGVAFVGHFSSTTTTSRSSSRSSSSTDDVDIPESFDCGEKWPQCKSVADIRDQGGCGSGWAFGLSEVLADRTCIATGANITLSPQYLMDCVSGRGCLGWASDLAWDALAENGTATESCAPYKGKAEVCRGKCADGSEPVVYRSRDARSIYVEGNITETVRQMQLEIMENGPVAATFYVYDDLYKYKSGVYYHGKSASYSGKHLAKIVGWGVDSASGLPYWRVASSWSSSFGEDGYFRILRGTDESGIEYKVSVGYPLI